MRATGLAIALLTLVLTACGSPDDDTPRDTAPTVARPMFQDQHLRSVRMTGGRALGYVQPETASQILCQLLDKAGWERLLGGRVGRKPLNAPYAGCMIATGKGAVSLRLLDRDAAFEADTTVAGHPSTVDDSEPGSPVVTVALSDDALQPAPRQYYPVRRLLEMKLIEHDVEFGTRILGEIVPMLTAEVESLPEIDGQGHVRYVSTPLAGADEFVDLPRPVQALQLCTALLENLEIAATRIDARDTGECELGTAAGPIGVAAQHKNYPADYPTKIAGRPAWTPADPPVVRVLLRDDADVDLFVSAPDSLALAEKVVPLLVG